MKKPIILCVDDEKFFLSSLKNEIVRIFSNKVSVEIAESGEEALELISELVEDSYEIPIIISDYVMNGMYGDEFLKLSNEKCANSKKILLTGQATLEGVKNAINIAGIYRYIIKPWDSTDLNLTLSEAFRVYFKEKLIEIQRKHISESGKQFESKFKMMTNEIEKRSDEKISMLMKAFGSNINDTLQAFLSITSSSTNNPIVKRISRLMGLVDRIFWNNPDDSLQVKLGLLLSQLYYFGLDEKLQTKLFNKDIINSIELKKIALARNNVYLKFRDIAIFKEISELINDNYDYLDDLSDSFIPNQGFKNRRNILIIIKLVCLFDGITQKGFSVKHAIKNLYSLKIYDENLINALTESESAVDSKTFVDFEMKAELFEEPKKEEYLEKDLDYKFQNVSFNDLKRGMVLTEDIEDSLGNVLVPSGQEIFEDLLIALMKFRQHQKLKEPIKVLMI